MNNSVAGLGPLQRPVRPLAEAREKMGSRKSDIDPFERGLLVAKMLLMGKPISTKVLRDEFGVSKASAKRAMVVIELALNADAVVGERGQTILAAHPGRLQTKA